MVLVVHQVFAADHQVEHPGRVGGLLAAFPFGGLLAGAVVTQQVDQFVEQRHIGHRPRGAVCTPQRRVGACGAEPVVRGVELGEKGFRRQHRPQLVQRRGEAGMVFQFVDQVGAQVLPGGAVVTGQPSAPDPGDRAFGQHPGDDVDEHRPGLVVRRSAGPRFLDGPLGGLGVDTHRDVGEVDRQRIVGRPLAVGDRRRQDVEHLQRTLRRGGRRAVLGGDRQVGHQITGGGEHDIGLTQRGQDPPDVVEEVGVRPDDEHAVALQAFAPRVEQVGDTVQGHDRLAGAGAALDDQDPGVVAADDLVLLCLDGGDDVAHAVTARRVHRRQQGCVTGSVAVVARGAEKLVCEVDDPPTEVVELATSAHVLGVRPGRHVERARRRRAPVDQHRLVVVILVEQPDTTDVGALTGNAVQAAEAQSVVGHIPPVHLLGQRTYLDVAVHQRPAVAAQCCGVAGLQPGAFGIETFVELRHVGPFGAQFVSVVGSRHGPLRCVRVADS